MSSRFNSFERPEQGDNQSARAHAAFEEIDACCRELVDFVDDERLHSAAAGYFARWEARMCHTIAKRLGDAEKDRFQRAMPKWKEELRRSPSVKSVADRHCLGYLTPLLKELREQPDELFSRVDAEMGSRAAGNTLGARGNAIFIVHGHNHKLKDEVASFLQRIHGERPTILHEQPDGGRTIIEKLEHFANQACFAVVLLTSDDPGFEKEARLWKKFPEKRPGRARQNVVLELGYFWARLGRSKVVILYQEGIELPSDADGVLYKVVDSGGAWKGGLAKEMKNAGLTIDFTEVL